MLLEKENTTRRLFGEDGEIWDYDLDDVYEVILANCETLKLIDVYVDFGRGKRLSN